MRVAGVCSDAPHALYARSTRLILLQVAKLGAPAEGTVGLRVRNFRLMTACCACSTASIEPRLALRAGPFPQVPHTCARNAGMGACRHVSAREEVMPRAHAVRAAAAHSAGLPLISNFFTIFLAKLRFSSRPMRRALETCSVRTPRSMHCRRCQVRSALVSTAAGHIGGTHLGESHERPHPLQLPPPFLNSIRYAKFEELLLRADEAERPVLPALQLEQVEDARGSSFLRGKKALVLIVVIQIPNAVISEACVDERRAQHALVVGLRLSTLHEHRAGEQLVNLVQ